MKGKKLVATAIVATVVGVLGWSIASQANQPVKTIQDINKLTNMMIQLESPTISAKISKEEATQAASLTYDGLAKQATNIVAEYHLLTDSGFTSAGLPASAKQKNPQIAQGLYRTPVYIVTFQGVAIKSKGRKSGQAPVTMNEYNVVVDANTGEVLYGFGYSK